MINNKRRALLEAGECYDEDLPFDDEPMPQTEPILFKKDIAHRALFRLTLAAFFLAIVVVVLGAFTRLVDAGLGCPDWPGCYGHLLWPNDSHEIAQAEARFPDAPVELDKTWPEMVHRYFAGGLGLLILAITVIATRRHNRLHSEQSPLPRVPVKLPALLLVMVIIQAAFGMWTVTLKLWPQVVTAHLLGGFATLSMIWLLGQRLGGVTWQLSSNHCSTLDRLKPLLLLALVAVVVQITLGGWVSSNYAALACPDFPRCLGQWLPPTDFAAGFNIFQEVGPNYLGGQLDNHARTAIHLTHRVGAILVLLIVVGVSMQLWRIDHSGVRAWALILAAVLFLQLALGVSNIVWSLPLAVAVAHNAVGALLLLTLLSIIYRAYTVEKT